MHLGARLTLRSTGMAWQSNIRFASSCPAVQAQPPRKTDFTHTPDQIWHIAAENQRTVKRLMDISHRKIEWTGAQKSKVCCALRMLSDSHSLLQPQIVGESVLHERGH